jgi:translation initiation factor 3 subunit B
MKDRMAQSKVSEEILEKRRSLMGDFTAWRDKKKQEWQDNAAVRSQLRDGRDDVRSEGVEEETIEFITKEEAIPLDE